MIIKLISIDFSAIDHTAITIVIAGLMIVFSALISIYLFFRYILPAFLRMTIRRKVILKGQNGSSPHLLNIQGDVSAAIGMALYLHFNEIHDEESNVITIKRVSRTYSPWSSKLYSMRNLK
jgi:hypothetical protein